MLAPDATVTPDIRCRLPGRGLWLGADRDTIREAVRRNLFARGFRAPARAPEALAELVDNLLRKEALDALSLANKAGFVITGYEKIRDALTKRRLGWVMHARDAAEDGCQRLDRLAVASLGKTAVDAGLPASDEHGADEHYTNARETGGPVLPRFFTACELGLALGRQNVIHIGLKQEEAARRFRRALLKAVAFSERPQE